MNEIHTHTTGPRVPDALIYALIAVESGGKDDAIGDGGKAVGCLQIHEILVEDVNRIIDIKGKGGLRFTAKDRINRESSIAMCRIYLEHYTSPMNLPHRPTLEDMARIWNGGPMGWKKPATVKYWEKVRPLLLKGMVGTMGGNLLIDGLFVDAPPAPTHQIKPNGDVVPLAAPDYVAQGRDIAQGQFSAQAFRDYEDRVAWDRYASALLANLGDMNVTHETAAIYSAKGADAMLAERRKRFPAS